MYVICGPNEHDEETGEMLFWSNQFGWTRLTDADTFTRTQKSTLNLPIGGKWRKLPQ